MAKNTSTEYVSLFAAVYKMPNHSVDARQQAGFWFSASLALSGVLSPLCPLYCSLSILTAIRESNQVGSLQPTTLVSYQAEFDMIFDSGDLDALKNESMGEAALAATTWRDEMKTSGIAKTQIFARTLKSKGYNGLMVRSFAKGV
jgi:hypothetical protein